MPADPFDTAHLTVPAGGCDFCLDAEPQRAGGWIGHVVTHWPCKVHGTVVRVQQMQAYTLTLRAGHHPSPTVRAWLRLVLTSGASGKVRLPKPAAWQRWLDSVPGGPPKDEATAMVFALHRLTGAEMVFFLAHRVSDPARAQRWAMTHIPLTEEAMGCWLASGIHPGLASRWAALGVDPDVASRFHEPEDWAFVVHANAPHEQQWAALRSCASPSFVAAGIEQGREREVIARLARALTASLGDEEEGGQMWPMGVQAQVVTSVWSRTRGMDCLRVARALRGHDWADAAACLETGMGVEEMLAHLRCGAEMDPVRVVAALAR